MLGTRSPVGLIRMGRQLYVLLLAAGVVGLSAMILSDSQGLLTGRTVPTAAAPRSAMRPLTAGQSMDGFGAWSPDGKQIAFMRDGIIWLMSAAGGTPKPLSGKPVPDGQERTSWHAVPVWRPDGKEIAFIELSASGTMTGIIGVDPASGKRRSLAGEAQQPIGHLAWAPDGKQIYYSTPREVKRVELSTAKTSRVLALEESWEMLAGGLAIHPDGKRAVVGAGPRVERGVAYDLWLIAVDGSGQDPERLTRGGGIMPAFSPKGDRLVYRNPRQATGIYEMDLKTHGNRRIVADEQRAMYFHPAYSPDGKSVLLSRLVLDGGAGTAEKRGRLTSHLYLHTLTASGS